MAFVTDGAGDVISFAEYTDVVQTDQRLFEENRIVIPEESGFATIQDFIEDILEKSTSRILLKMKASSWWLNYNAYVNNYVSDINNLPSVNPNLIDPGNKQGRRTQFTTLCVSHALKESILPLIAEFTEDSPDLAKIVFYDKKFNDLFSELISLADWFDYDNSGTVEADEKLTTFFRTRRTRRRASIVKVR